MTSERALKSALFIRRNALERMRSAINPYQVLGVPEGCAMGVAKAAHRALASMFHPDRNVGDEEAAQAMASVNVAWDTIEDPAKRRRMDTINHTEACKRCGGAGTVLKQKGFKAKVSVPCPECSA